LPIILYAADVDGTLIHSIGKDANKLHKECFSAGFKEVFGLDTHIDIIPHHGGTDPLIAIKVLEHHGIPKAEVGLVGFMWAAGCRAWGLGLWLAVACCGHEGGFSFFVGCVPCAMCCVLAVACFELIVTGHAH
jgi:hypothetical protein